MPRLATYVYTGWHPIPERDQSFHPGFTEWELVRECRPRFEGHWQPRRPLFGPYDDRDPLEVARRMQLGLDHGIEAFVFGVFWCRGKRVFESGLDQGFLESPLGRSTPFAVMWANRMPRRVLPVRRADLPVIDATRQVPSDVADFLRFIQTLAAQYFARPNYLRIRGKSYLSIFDSTFFLRELGPENAALAIREARAWLQSEGYPGLHLAAVEPNADALPRVADLGFDSVTHYVFLPEWKGPLEQDYDQLSLQRSQEWSHFRKRSGLPYMPSVATGWDASPRAADFGSERPHKYPWSPVVTGTHPEAFARALGRARAYSKDSGLDDEDLLFVASWNEWSEGHYLEPDERYGMGWLEALAAGRD